jgi:hypothetical protein
MKLNLAFLFAITTALMTISITNELHIFTFAAALSFMAIVCVAILEKLESN